jgi:hypothetical protein
MKKANGSAGPAKGSLYKRLEGEIKDLNKKIALIVK